MAYMQGDASDHQVILDELADFLSDTLKMGAEVWSIKRKTADELIVMAPGLSGQDQIYVGIKAMNDTNTGQQYWLTNGFVGFDSLLSFWEQPGCIPLASKPPAVPFLNGSAMHYWFIANGQRVIVVIKIGTRYEVMYLGFFQPYALPKQFPYPLIVGGSLAGTTANKYSWLMDSPDHRHFVNPGTGDGSYATSLRMRRPDGAWRGFFNRTQADALSASGNGVTWPFITNNQALLRNLDTEIPVFPIILGEQSPTNMLGELDGCYWVSGQGIAAEDTVTFGTDVLLILPNVARTAQDEYWAVKLS